MSICISLEQVKYSKISEIMALSDLEIHDLMAQAEIAIHTHQLMLQWLQVILQYKGGRQ